MARDLSSQLIELLSARIGYYFDIAICVRCWPHASCECDHHLEPMNIVNVRMTGDD